MSPQHTLSHSAFTEKKEPTYRYAINEVLSDVPLRIKKRLVNILRHTVNPGSGNIGRKLDDLAFEQFPKEYSEHQVNPFFCEGYPTWYFVFRDSIILRIQRQIHMDFDGQVDDEADQVERDIFWTLHEYNKKSNLAFE